MLNTAETARGPIHYRPGYARSSQHRPIAWYPARALTYARHATDWESPQAGTKSGHFKRHSLRALGVKR